MSYEEDSIFDVEMAELKELGFGIDFLQADIKKYPDRLRRGYYEIYLETYDPRPMEFPGETLERKDCELVDWKTDSLTYYSPDGRTAVYLDKVWNFLNEVCKITIVRGGLSEGELPEAEREVMGLFYEL